MNWRHLLEALRRKPGAFRRYRYREHFFPSVLWRKAYDDLQQRLSESRAEREYLALLGLAIKEEQQVQVEAVIERLLGQGKLTLDNAKEALGITAQTREATAIPVLEADLSAYDALVNER